MSGATSSPLPPQCNFYGYIADSRLCNTALLRIVFFLVKLIHKINYNIYFRPQICQKFPSKKKFIFISSSLLFAKIFSLLFLILQIHSFGNSNKIRENRGCCWLENTIFFQKRGQEGDNQNLLFGDFLDGAHHHQQIWLLISRQANIERRKCYPHNFFSKLCCWGSKNVLFDWFFFRIWFFCRPLFWSILRSYFAMNSYARLYIASYMHSISYYVLLHTLRRSRGRPRH